ncbi:MAG: insulinase family protein [Rhizobiales bacterium]|nr:insulinase family protein [Hyphomicrobiales bacterium]
MLRASLSLVAIFLFSAVHDAGAQTQRFAPDAVTFNLENGMQVVAIPDHRAPVVTHMVWYRVGSADEPSGKSGVAHFLEHLMFKGTTANPDGAFSARVAQIGGQENAFTSTDYTGYFQRVAKEWLPLMMEFEADRMANLVLNEAEVASERDVIREERRSRVDNNPGSQLGEELQAVLYRSHPYGRPVIGWEHEIAALNLEDAIDFYNTYYSPNNAILIVAGDVDPEEVLELAEKYYGPLERRAEFGPRVRAIEPAHRGPRRIEISNELVRQPSVQRLHDVPSYTTAPAGDAEALDMLAEILGGGTASRLYRALIIDQRVATGTSAWYSSSGLDSGKFGFYASPRPGTELVDLEAAILEVINNIKANGVTEQEVIQARTNLVAAAVFAQDSQSALARVFGVALTTGQTVEDVQDWPNRIAQVTAADIQRVAEMYLDPIRSATGFLQITSSAN